MQAALDLKRNHFELFGLPMRFELALDALQRRYRDIQAEVHPDRFAQAGEAERRLSMQWSTRVNEAYQVLKSPLKRAAYLLEQQGIDIGVENNTAMPAQFLMAQMEWREALEEATEARSIEQLEGLRRRLGEEKRAEYETLAAQIDGEQDLPNAAQTVRRLMFLERLQEEIDASIADLED